jgi:hypothetical protein
VSWRPPPKPGRFHPTKKTNHKSNHFILFSVDNQRPHSWVFRLFWVQRKNLVDEKKFVNFCRKCQIKFRGPLSQSEIIFTCEHVFTSHWILNVWLVFVWFLFLNFCFDLIHRHFLLDKLKRGKQLDPVRVFLKTPVRKRQFLSILFFLFLFILWKFWNCGGEREKKKKQKSRTLRERERRQILSSVTSVGYIVGSGRVRTRGDCPALFFLFFFFLPCFIPLKQVGNNKTIKQMKTKKQKKILFSPNFLSCGR